MNKGKISRRQEREQAFILIFERLFSRDPIREIIDAAESSEEVQISDFAEKTASGVEQHEPELDEKIEKNIRGWKIGRLSKVAFSLLRLAVYEMMYQKDIPVGVSINEAVDLAKKYGGAEDAPFLNGVLGSIAKELEPGDE